MILGSVLSAAGALLAAWSFYRFGASEALIGGLMAGLIFQQGSSLLAKAWRDRRPPP